MSSLISIQSDLYRLIPSRFPPVAVYEGLVSSARMDELVEVENLTNPRLRSEARLRTVYSGATTPALQNWNLAPFKYINPEGSRFFDPSRPALELADDWQTALAISVRRRETFLERTREEPIGLDMRMLKTPVSGRFVDLRHYPVGLSREERWDLGREISDDAEGIVYRPPERPSALCVAVLRGTCLGRTVQCTHYRFVWDGRRVATLYAFDGEGKVIKAERLGEVEDTLAA
jgi:hypothetical protein